MCFIDFFYSTLRYVFSDVTFLTSFMLTVSLFPIELSACYISWFFSADDPHVQYSAVSSFVFLRFFAVAVVSPHTFHLRPHHPVSFVKLCSVLFITVKSVYLARQKLLSLSLLLGQ